jgi:hypothetical protein
MIRQPYACGSITEAVANFAEDLAGVVVVEAAVGEAVVEQRAAIGYVGGADGRAEFVAERFTDGEVEAGVVGQILIGIGRCGVRVAVVKTRTEGVVGGGVGVPR